jgi:hypothetical protein
MSSASWLMRGKWQKSGRTQRDRRKCREGAELHRCDSGLVLRVQQSKPIQAFQRTDVRLVGIVGRGGLIAVCSRAAKR